MDRLFLHRTSTTSLGQRPQTYECFIFMSALVGTDSNTLFEAHVLEDNFSLAFVRFSTKMKAFC